MANLGDLVDFALTVTIRKIPRYKFTILRLFNILPYVSLYFEIQTDTLLVLPCARSQCNDEET